MRKGMIGTCPCCGRGGRRKVRPGQLTYVLPADRALREEIESRIPESVGEYCYTFSKAWPPSPRQIAAWREYGEEIRVLL